MRVCGVLACDLRGAEVSLVRGRRFVYVSCGICWACKKTKAELSERISAFLLKDRAFFGVSPVNFNSPMVTRLLPAPCQGGSITTIEDSPRRKAMTERSPIHPSKFYGERKAQKIIRRQSRNAVCQRVEDNAFHLSNVSTRPYLLGVSTLGD